MTNKANDFNRLINELYLSPEHRDELKSKRGFESAISDLLKFRSCGPGIPVPDCIDEKVKFALKKEDNILIPYLDSKGDVVHVRPHKYGFEDSGVKVYVPYPIMEERPERLIIAESEFKAAASCLLGISAVGIPGISACSRQYFDLLRDTIESLKIKRVVICFDNEVKGDPAHPKYKPDYTDRYDTEFYAFIMAQQLTAKGIPTKIAVLPMEWSQSGKVDIDHCLAMKMTKEQYAEIIDQAIDCHPYKNSWKFPRSHLSYLERRIDAWFYNGNIESAHNCYYIRKGKGEKQKISNFTIKVLHTIYGPKGTERYCQFRSKYGDSSKFILTPEMMSSKGSFVKACYEMGDYDFQAPDTVLQQLWSYIFMKQTGKTIKRLNYYGYAEDQEAWFFGNGAYRDGEYFGVDSDGIVWIDDEGFKIFNQQTIGQEESSEKKREDRDEFEPILSMEPPDYTLEDILEKVAVAYGDNYSQLLLGWILAIFFMPDIIKTYGVFPFLFLHGRVGRGKTTIANWITSFFGYQQKGYPFHSSTAVGITRITSQSSMLPVWLEEYRNNDTDIAKKNNFLRSVYDRSTVIKGTKTPDQIKSYKAKSTIILSGEEFPQDSALNSRCIMFPVYRSDDICKKEKEKMQEAYQWMEARKQRFNYFGHKILMDYQNLWPKVKAEIEKQITNFNAEMSFLASRVKIQTAIVAGVCNAIFSGKQGFESFVKSIAMKLDADRNSEEAVQIFLNDILESYGMGAIPFQFYRVEHEKFGEDINDFMYFWFNGLYNWWEQKYSIKGMRSQLPCSRKSIQEHLKQESYFTGTRQKRVDQKNLNLLCFNMNDKNFPETLRSIASMKDSSNDLGETKEIYYGDKAQGNN